MRDLELTGIRHGHEELTRLDEEASRAIADQCPNLAGGGFARLTCAELRVVFTVVDGIYLRGALQQLCQSRGEQLDFRLSARMTHTAGTTTWLRPRGRNPSPGRFVIAIAPGVIHDSFRLLPEATVCGVACPNMATALMRIMQHEMVHLLEFLCYGRSSCAADRFRQLVFRLFGHTESRHRLLTPHERARLTHGVQPGDLVEFEFEGRTMTGRINRISRRATVLVPDSSGARYTDGRHYRRFYVPLDLLRPTAGRKND